jgi:hypothetical protein
MQPLTSQTPASLRKFGTHRNRIAHHEVSGASATQLTLLGLTRNQVQKLAYSAGCVIDLWQNRSVSFSQEARRLQLSGGVPMTSDQARNELKVMVLIDLAAICRKVAEHSEVPDALRAYASEMVEEFNSLCYQFVEKAIRTSMLRAKPYWLRWLDFCPG